MSYNYPGRKRDLTRSISQGWPGLQRLLEPLSTKELAILQKHRDLIERAQQIDKMTLNQLVRELENEFGMEVDPLRNGSYFISVDKPLDFLPERMDGPEGGGWDVANPGGFIKWAEDFLMREVRINIWIRYIEYKKKLGSLGSGKWSTPDWWRENAGYL